MGNEEHIGRYTATDLDEMDRRGEFKTDWARIDAMTEEELEAAIDDEEEGVPDWRRIWVGIPPAGERHAVWIDVDVITWFEATGDGWMSRMNDILRDYVDAQKAQAAEREEALAARR